MDTPRWIKDAYGGTDVHWSRSQSEILKMLNSLGIYEVRFTNMRDRFALEFIVQIDEGKPRAVRILSPLHKQDQTEEKRTKELNIMHRMLLAHLKAKFLSVGRGLVEFEQEFMANLVIMDKAGNSTTMGEAILPQYRDNLESGENKDFKLLN